MTTKSPCALGVNVVLARVAIRGRLNLQRPFLPKCLEPFVWMSHATPRLA